MFNFYVKQFFFFLKKLSLSTLNSVNIFFDLFKMRLYVILNQVSFFLKNNTYYQNLTQNIYLQKIYKKTHLLLIGNLFDFLNYIFSKGVDFIFLKIIDFLLEIPTWKNYFWETYFVTNKTYMFFFHDWFILWKRVLKCYRKEMIFIVTRMWSIWLFDINYMVKLFRDIKKK